MPDPRLALGGVWRAPRTVRERGALDGGLTPPFGARPLGGLVIHQGDGGGQSPG